MTRRFKIESASAPRLYQQPSFPEATALHLGNADLQLLDNNPIFRLTDKLRSFNVASSVKKSIQTTGVVDSLLKPRHILSATTSVVTISVRLLM